MTDIVVFTEEASGKIVAEALAAKMGLASRTMCLEHQGRAELESSFPRKIAAWRGPKPPRFIVMRDNDGADCRERKAHLLTLAPKAAAERVKVRLVLQELESWYLGDLDAVARAELIDERKLARAKAMAKYREPEAIRDAKAEFKREIAFGGQRELARKIAPHLSLTSNRCKSFFAFIDALRWAAS